MSGRQSAATDRAVRLVLAGRMTRYAAARKLGLSISTVYRALKRHHAQEAARATAHPPV